jgi:hypothetical protein
MAMNIELTEEQRQDVKNGQTVLLNVPELGSNFFAFWWG